MMNNLQSSPVKWARLQKEYFESGATLNLAFRKEQLKKLRKLIYENTTGLLEALHKDLSKPAMEAYHSEIGLCLHGIQHTLENLEEWMRPRKAKTTLISFPSSAKIYPEPKGVCLIIAPWNYPALLIFSPLTGALAAGNTAILKPSEKTPHTAALLEGLFQKYFDERVVKLINGQGDKIIPPLLRDFRFDQIFFTGSRTVGSKIAAMAAEKLSPAVLELGGKSPVIVDRDTDLRVSARRIAFGKFFNAGQTCVAPDYLLLHEDVKEKFLKELTTAIEEFYGDDIRLSSSYARMVDQKHFQRVKKLMNDGRIIYGGDLVQDEKFIAPTIIEDVNFDDTIMKEEIFGPLLPVLLWKEKNELLKILRKNPHPLSFYLFTRNKKLRKFLISRFAFGGGMINNAILHLENVHLPFGGVGHSGYGNYHGAYSFSTFSHYKSVVHSSTGIDLRLKYPPYRNWVLKVSKKLVGRSI